ncbi:MAG: Fur family transcriptional regulator [Erysipelotrichaceae bacterium]
MKYKRSKQRDEIVSFINENPGHFSADEIYRGLKSQGSSISLATVYRNLGILEHMQAIDKISHPTNGYVYDKTAIKHHHLYCKACNRIHDVTVEHEAFDLSHVQQKNGIQIDAFSITFWGTCKQCIKSGDHHSM